MRFNFIFISIFLIIISTSFGVGSTWLFFPADASSFTTNWSAEFDGTDSEYIEWADIINIEYTDPFTLFAWVYVVDTTDDNSVFGKHDGSDAKPGFNLYFATGTSRFKIFMQGTGAGDVNVQADDNIATSTWVHVGLGYNGDGDSDNILIWVDGSPADLTDLSPGANVASTLIHSDGLQLGGAAFASWENFSGRLGDIALLPWKASDAEAAEIWNSDSELDMTTFSGWATMKADAKSMWVTWEADTFDSPNGVVDLTDNGYTGSAQGMADSTDKVSSSP